MLLCLLRMTFSIGFKKITCSRDAARTPTTWKMISIFPAAKDDADGENDGRAHDFSRATTGPGNTNADLSQTSGRPRRSASSRLRSPIARTILEAGHGHPADVEQVRLLLRCASIT